MKFNKKAIGSLMLLASFLSTSQAAEPVKVIHFGIASVGVGGIPVAGGTAFNTAQIKGTIDDEFKKDGIRIEWSFFKGAGPAVNEAIANKQLDFAWQGDLPAIVARAGGLKTKLILASDHLSPTYLAVPADSTAKSIEDLKDKKIAIFKGTNLQLVQIKVYKSLGLTEKDFKTINMDSATMQTALATKDIDGGWFGPEIYPLVDKGLARIVYSTKNKSPDFARSTHVLVTDDFEQQHPEIVQRVVTAILKENAWVSDENNRDQNLKYWARSGVTYEAYKRDHDGVSFKDRLSPLLDESFIEHYKEATAAAKEFKLIRKDIDVDSWFETKYLKKGLEDLGLQNFWQARDANGNIKS